jgi:hypothetical protein
MNKNEQLASRKRMLAKNLLLVLSVGFAGWGAYEMHETRIEAQSSHVQIASPVLGWNGAAYVADQIFSFSGTSTHPITEMKVKSDCELGDVDSVLLKLALEMNIPHPQSELLPVLAPGEPVQTQEICTKISSAGQGAIMYGLISYQNGTGSHQRHYCYFSRSPIFNKGGPNSFQQGPKELILRNFAQCPIFNDSE